MSNARKHTKPYLGTTSLLGRRYELGSIHLAQRTAVRREYAHSVADELRNGVARHSRLIPQRRDFCRRLKKLVTSLCHKGGMHFKVEANGPRRFNGCSRPNDLKNRSITGNAR